VRAHVRHIGKHRLQNNHAGVFPRREPRRGSTAHRPPKDHNVVGRKVFCLCQVPPAGLCVAVDAPLRRRAGALPVPAVIDEQHVEAELVELLNALQPPGDIAGVAVEEEERVPRPCVGGDWGNPPGAGIHHPWSLSPSSVSRRTVS